MRRALQYGPVTAGRSRSTARIRRSRGRAPARGHRLGRAGRRRLAFARREPQVARDLHSPPTRGSRSTSCTSRRASRSTRSDGRGGGVGATGEVTPHHLVPYRRGRPVARPEPEDEPAARRRDDRAALDRGAARRHDHLRRDRPRAALRARRRTCRSRTAPFGVTGLETAFAALYTHLVVPGLVPLATLLERMSAGPARAFRPDRPARSRSARRRTSSMLDLGAEWTVPEDGFRSRSANSWLLGAAAAGAVTMTVARPGAWSHEMTRSWARGRHGLPRRIVGAPGFAFGEAVFTTAMTGYQEVVTDPSFAGRSSALPLPWSVTTASPTTAPSRGVRTRRRSSCARRVGPNGRTGCTRTASRR